METKITEFSDGRRIISGIDENGNIVSELYSGDRPTDPEPAPVVDIKKVQSLVELSNALTAKGFKRGTPEYYVEYEKYRGDLPLEKNRK